MMMWQPIETAPKDGSSILLATAKGRIADGFWSTVYGVWSWPYVMVEPTHWMPLPGRPSAQAQPAPGAPWVSLAERMPNPDMHDRVLIYTEGYDFGGEQVFDVKVEALNECRYIDPDEQPETCKAASHWMPHPRNAMFDYAAHCAQPAPSVKDAIIDDLQSQFDSEGITEHDSGDALIRLSDAIAAVEDNFAQPAPSVPDIDYLVDTLSEFADHHVEHGQMSFDKWTLRSAVEAMLMHLSTTQPAPSVPDGWLPVPEKHPTFDPVDLQLSDGSVLCGCVPQADGDYWWEGPSGEVFIDPKYANVTHWRLNAAPKREE